jgi:hypothetical protein
MALPVGRLDTELPFDEIDIAPFKRHHLTAPYGPQPSRRGDCYDNAVMDLNGGRLRQHNE